MAKTEEVEKSPSAEAVEERLEAAEEGVEGRKSKAKVEEQFRQQQQQAAEGQNQSSPNAVPEQRPQATQETLPYHHSSLHNDLEEAGLLPDNEPMPAEAYEKAASDEQAKAAAKESRTPRLFDGAHVRVLKDPYFKHNVVGAVVRVEFDDHKEAEKARSGEAALNTFAEPSRYIVKLRSRNEQVSFEPDEVEEISRTDYEGGA